MSIIEIQKLTKSYRVYQKQEGLGASIAGLFRREYREVRAVRAPARPLRSSSSRASSIRPAAPPP